MPAPAAPARRPRSRGRPATPATWRCCFDIEALRRGHTTGQELCEITGVGPIPVPVARGLLGQAIVKLVITRGVEVAKITHLGRGPTAAQRAALLWTNPICAVQGCRHIEPKSTTANPGCTLGTPAWTNSTRYANSTTT